MQNGGTRLNNVLKPTFLHEAYKNLNLQTQRDTFSQHAQETVKGQPLVGQTNRGEITGHIYCKLGTYDEDKNKSAKWKNRARYFT